MENTDELIQVTFTSSGIDCIAIMGMGLRLINFRTCTAYVNESDEFTFNVLPDGSAKCSVGTEELTRFWFDTDEESAKKISDLFMNSTIQ